MPYSIQPETALPDEIRRIVREQIDRALAELSDPGLDVHVKVHQLRKRCKKIRAVARLVAGPLKAQDRYSLENHWYRDIAREVSDARDAAAAVETYDVVMDAFDPWVRRQGFAPIRGRLTRGLKGVEEDGQLGETLDRLVPRLREGWERVGEWRIPADPAEALVDGWVRTYKKGRKACKKLEPDDRPKEFHEWRKRVKYHLYHCRLLKKLSPDFAERRKCFDRLSDLLGDAHDIAELAAWWEKDPDAWDGIEGLPAFRALVHQRRIALRREALEIGRGPYARKAKHLRQEVMETLS